jgi:hypothetical protein
MSEGVSRSLRRAHKWAAIAVAVPLLVVIATGIFLQVRKPVEWIQPASERGSATFKPQVSQQQVLDAVRAVPRMNVDGWDDLLLTDYRPRKGIIKVRTPGHLETQVDAATGAVIKTGQRWNDYVMKIHDGSAFGGRLWLFLPAGIGALFLTISGLYMGFVAGARRWRRHRHRLRRAKRVDVLGARQLNFTQFCFKYHYWAALLVMIPWLIVVSTGLVLQLRHEIPGVVPDFKQGISNTPRLDYQQVLEVAKTIPELKVKGWSDIWRVYTHPPKGIIEIRTKIGYGAQLDASTGAVLDVYARGGDFWEDLHEGIFGRHRLEGKKIFGDLKANLSMWVFLPVNIIALFLWFSGVVVALRISVEKAAPAQLPASEEATPAMAAAGGVGQTTKRMTLPVTASEPAALLEATAHRGRRWRRADKPGKSDGEANRPADPRRAATGRATATRRADIREASDRAPVQKPPVKASWQARTSAAWRRRTG